MLMMQVIFFSLSHENCGCYGINGNSQNVAKTMDLDLTIQALYVNRFQCSDYAHHLFFPVA